MTSIPAVTWTTWSVVELALGCPPCHPVPRLGPGRLPRNGQRRPARSCTADTASRRTSDERPSKGIVDVRRCATGSRPTMGPP